MEGEVGRCVAIVASRLKGRVTEALFESLADPSVRGRLSGSDPTVVTPVADELDAIDRDLAALARLWGDGTVSRQEWEAAREGLASRGQALRNRLGVLSVPAFDPVDLPDRWDAMGLAGRRTILAAVFSRIEVHRARTSGYEPDRIKLTWRVTTTEDTRCSPS